MKSKIFLFFLLIIAIPMVAYCQRQNVVIPADSVIKICVVDLLSRGIDPKRYNITLTPSILTKDSLKTRFPAISSNKRALKGFRGKKFYEVLFQMKGLVLDGFFIYFVDVTNGNILHIHALGLPPRKEIK